MNFEGVFVSIITFFSTLLGGLIAKRYKDNLGVLAAFASGVLIAVPLFDLLPESFNLAKEVVIPIENIMYSTALGFIFLYILERYISVHRVCGEDICKNERHQSGGFIAAAELSIHSYMDGFAIGLGFQFGLQVGLIVAVAVICHDFSDGLNTVTIMLKSGNSLKASIRMLLLDASTPVLGAISTLFIQLPEQYLVLILPFFAGGFLYLGASELLPEAHEKNPPLIAIICSLTGFLLIFILTSFLNI
ncbi:MAG: ZIP family metal transporter [Promethearchaeota archaeon]